MAKKIILSLLFIPVIYFVSSCENSTQTKAPTASQSSAAKSIDPKSTSLENLPRGKVVSIKIFPIALQMDQSEHTTIKATINLRDGSTESSTVIWKSSNMDVASIDSKGNITSYKVGNAKITAISMDEPSISAVMDLTVNERVSKQSPLLLGFATPTPATGQSGNTGTKTNGSTSNDVLLGVPTRLESPTPAPKK